MKSIEERGQIAGQTYQFCKKEIEADHKIYEKGYIKGATEQKAIDEKAYTEEMRQLNEEWKANLDIQRAMLIEKAKEVFNKTCGWLAVYPWYNGVFEEFVKAMEE